MINYNIKEIICQQQLGGGVARTSSYLSISNEIACTAGWVGGHTKRKTLRFEPEGLRFIEEVLTPILNHYILSIVHGKHVDILSRRISHIRCALLTIDLLLRTNYSLASLF